MRLAHLITSESVSEGHPDKICDQVSDAVLDAYLRVDPHAHVACDTFVTSKYMLLGGEIQSKQKISTQELEEIARSVVCDIGYNNDDYGYNCDTFEFESRLHQQSQEIANAVVNDHLNLGAGDQGMMFGYACNETSEYMPFSILLAHKLLRELANIRKNTKLMPYLRPDAKCQITVSYDSKERLDRIETIVLSTQHEPFKNSKIALKTIRRDVKRILIPRLLDKLSDKDRSYFHDDIQYFINPSGSFIAGGPFCDTGLTGRKIIVDTYGGHAPHGGGAFSGKDATKVDRSAAYMARYIAKNIVAAGLTDRCTFQISYAIGYTQPISIYIDDHNTAKINPHKIERAVRELFDMSPSGIIQKLDLYKPIYQKTSAYGHFGRTDFDFNWEKLGDVEELLKIVDYNKSRTY
ncbi:MAG TPA: methionine adenosyltransferase [Balneolales bacterium]|nr:methionine adenosyltransferase [Balneolales bacterium]